jgi:hypothetical protein
MGYCIPLNVDQMLAQALTSARRMVRCTNQAGQYKQRP